MDGGVARARCCQPHALFPSLLLQTLLETLSYSGPLPALLLSCVKLISCNHVLCSWKHFSTGLGPCAPLADKRGSLECYFFPITSPECVQRAYALKQTQPAIPDVSSGPLCAPVMMLSLTAIAHTDMRSRCQGHECIP